MRGPTMLAGMTSRGCSRSARARSVFDPETGAASGRLVVDAGSGESGSKKRDKSRFTVQGMLERLGKSRPVDVVSAEAEFPIPFVDWGMHDSSIRFLRVEKVVQMKISLESTLESGVDGAT